MVLQVGVADYAADVTPSDSTVLAKTRGLYVGTSGHLAVTMESEQGSVNVTFSNHPVGYAPLRVIKVLSTGTAASNIVALY
jgi:hypothetical protein